MVCGDALAPWLAARSRKRSSSFPPPQVPIASWAVATRRFSSCSCSSRAHPPRFFKVWARYAIAMAVCCSPRARVRPLSLPSLPRTRSSLRSLRSLDLPGPDTVSLVASASYFEIVSAILSRKDGKRRADAGLTHPLRDMARHTLRHSENGARSLSLTLFSLRPFPAGSRVHKGSAKALWAQVGLSTPLLHDPGPHLVTLPGTLGWCHAWPSRAGAGPGDVWDAGGEDQRVDNGQHGGV